MRSHHGFMRGAVAAALLAAVLALVVPASAQAFMTTGNGGWVWQNPLPMSTPLSDVCFVDSLHGWAVGGYSQEAPLAAGTILATTDGGQTWTSEPVADNVDFYAVDFVDAQHGWAAGVGPNWQGVVYATDDGGATWLLRWADASDLRELSDLTFVDALHGWAIAAIPWGNSPVSEVLATSDGGRTWRTQWAGRCSGLGNVTFSDASHGWVAAGSFLLRTSDAGATWSKVGLAQGAQASAVAFADADHGWAVGRGVLATTDGGSTWTRQVPASTPLSDIAAVDPHHAWACGEGGGVIGTTDGRTWTQLRSFEKADWSPSAMSFSDASHGVMVGGEGPSNILWTSDSGATWNPAGSSAAASYDDGDAISFADASHGWVVGPSVLATSDGGATWSAQALPFAGDRYESLSDVSCVDAQHAWAVSDEGNIYATSDGTKWHLQAHFTPSGGNPVELNGVFFRDTSYGWAVGTADYERGLLYATTDGGVRWRRQSLSLQGTFADLCDVFFVSRSHGWAVGGDNGPVIFATTDGGAHWHKQLSRTADSFLECVDFVDPLHGWAGGYDPAIGASGGPLMFATSNGGVTWRKVVSLRGVEEPISDIAFTDAEHGCVVGSEGLVLVTENGGRSWRRQDPGTGLDLYGVAAIDGQHAWITGENGTILATTTAGYSLAPVTAAHGAPAWTRSPAIVTLSAIDSPGGAGMIGGLAGTEYSIDGGSWASGTTVTIPAPRNHTNDGLHVVNYRSSDALGNLETPKAFSVVVDTLGPTTQVAAASGHVGRAVSLHYVVRDALSPQASDIKLVVKSKSGKIVKVISLGSNSTGSWHLVRWKPRASGIYHYCVYAKDLAGNSQSRLGTAVIKVR